MKKLFSLFIATILFISISFSQEKDPKQITMTDIWTTYSFYPHSVYGIRSMNDGEYYTTLEMKRNIVKYSYKTGKKANDIFVLSNVANESKPKRIDDYWFSADEKKILLSTEVEQIYRHSFKAEYYVYDIAKKTFTKLSLKGKQEQASFSPDGTKIAFVRDNNLFYKDLATGKEIKITEDGKINSIINGKPDWVYEEEFSFSQAYEWSADSKNIAFLRFDESRVKEYELTMYKDLYPTQYKFKYPKAGEDNSIVTLHVYNLDTKKTKQINTGEETDQYIPRIYFTKKPNILAFVRLNRLQNNYELIFDDISTDKQTVVYNEKDKSYVDVENTKVYFINDNNFILQSERNGFTHLYLYDFNGKLTNQITKGKWEVTEFLGYNKKTNIVYYISDEQSPMKRALYSVKLDGSDKKLISKRKGTNDVKFSKTFKYYINYYTNANIPEYITLNDAKGNEKRVLEDNSNLVEKIKEYNFSKKEFFTFNTSDGVTLNGWMIKPPDFNPNKKYPVYMYLYGGPGNQQVLDTWTYDIVWHEFLAQHGYIVACVDNRGTGGRGAEFKKLTYGQLGKYETEDQISAAKYYQTLPYVNPERIGIQGWSFGGYMSTLCLAKGNDVFKAAIAVAPVTNWRYYDSIYTERYMGLPKDNAGGYDDNSPINFVRKIKGKYLLVHGTADDNVHFQNSIMLVDALVKANKQFEMQFYPNKNHGIYGGNTRYHLFTRMFNFVKDNL